jgi:signal transduction histidine kinase
LRKIFRTISRASRESEAWPVVLLLLAVLVPAVCVLWFMGAAMRNERLAARQKLADAYRVQLSASQARLQKHWKETAAELEKLAAATSAPVAFAACARSGLVDGVILFDEMGRVDYPNAPSAVNDGLGELEPKWQEASRLEHLRNFVEAAKQYDALAREATNANVAARAFQAEARCLVRAGEHDVAIQLVNDAFGNEPYSRAADPQGRLIAANAELMALELITNRISPLFQSIAHRLAARLTDYENPVLAAPQRRFLMKELQELSPERLEFPTLAAEQLAAEASERFPLSALEPGRSAEFLLGSAQAPGRAEPELGAPVQQRAWSEGRGKFVLQRSALPDLWQFTAPNQRVLALIRLDKLVAATKAALAADNSLADVKVTLAPPDVETPDAFVTLPVGEPMPGWRLTLSLADREFFDATAGRQSALYVWTAMLVLAGMGVLTVSAVRLVRRQLALARLKNDLAATVSHELKTPLSSMRVLVETLLDSEHLEEQKTREYLHLIAQENERLGRLIQNFLTFSRLERRKHKFHFSPLPARQVVDAAVQSVGGRFNAPGCRLDVQIEENLPPVMADPDALATALINLLENACKYTEEIKHIVLCARTENGKVIFSVKDNGIGIAPRERRRIFQPFHQVDQRLSRKGSGCGLGLSIVQFITTAHHGSVSVESQPGCGSTFSISLPAAAGATSFGKEAIA